MKLSERVVALAPSATMSLEKRAREMAAQGIDVISFATGEPDFPTPQNICQANVRAMEQGFTKYATGGGLPELKTAIATKLQKENGLTYGPSEIMVSGGAKQAIYNIILALCDEKDEVMIPSPYWVSFPPQVELVGAVPVIVETYEKDRFKLKASQLRRSVTKKTKLLILNSPNNPTGMAHDEDELRALAEVVLEGNFYVLSDECYEKLLYDGKRNVSIAALSAEIRERVITVNSLSKTYAMTGWRIGYAAGPAAVIQAGIKIQGQTTSDPNTMAQKAGVEALLGDQSSVEKMRAEFDRRRKYMVKRLNDMPGISCLMPDGTFYAFANVSGLFRDGRRGSGAVAEVWLNEAKVAVVPGAAFGSDEHVRFVFAASMEKIEEGLNRIAKVL